MRGEYSETHVFDQDGAFRYTCAGDDNPHAGQGHGRGGRIIARPRGARVRRLPAPPVPRKRPVGPAVPPRHPHDPRPAASLLRARRAQFFWRGGEAARWAPSAPSTTPPTTSTTTRAAATSTSSTASTTARCRTRCSRRPSRGCAAGGWSRSSAPTGSASWAWARWWKDSSTAPS